MLRYLLISFIVAICIVNYSSVSDAQVRNIAPYLGASGSFGHGFGWGIEGGARFFSFYAGLEDGAYYDIPHVSQQEFGPPPPSSAKYVGIHAGILTDSSTLIGIVVLQSHWVWDSYDSTKTFWDFGIDIKHSLNESHIYFAFALSYWRGIKFGLGYMF